MGLDGRGRWYRWDKKNTVDNYLSLDLKRLVRSVDLDRYAILSWQWTRGGAFNERKSSVTITVVPGQGLRLHYRFGDVDIEPYMVPITYTTPNYGGRRPWFVCPNMSCHRRVRILYGGKYFLCRKCHGLTYEICQQGKADARQTAIRNRLWAIRHKLGASGGLYDPLPKLKPAYMHWRTYERLAGEYDDLVLLERIAMTQSLAVLTRGVDVLGEDSSLSISNPIWTYPVDDEWKQQKRNRREKPDVNRRHYLWRIQNALSRREVDDGEADDNPNRLTLGDLARLADVPYVFAKEAVRERLVNPDQGRAVRRKRYRRRLAHWLGKLYRLRTAGQSWEEIRMWTKRRWKSGNEHERRWPAMH